MKRLDDIPKKNIFEVPDGYFDRLPQQIQARVARQSGRPAVMAAWWPMVRLAMPLVLMLGIGIFWWTQRATTFEQQLASIDADQLALYLQDADFTTEELTETVTWSEEDMNALESTVFETLESTSTELDYLMEELDLEENL